MTGVPSHTPASQVSPVVQELLSSQLPPEVGVKMQPVAELHVSSVPSGSRLFSFERQCETSVHKTYIAIRRYKLEEILHRLLVPST